MSVVKQLFQEAAFGPEITRLMGEAFERAARSLHDTGQPDLIKEVIARRIIDAARRGVRDPRELCIEATQEPRLEGRLPVAAGPRQEFRDIIVRLDRRGTETG